MGIKQVSERIAELFLAQIYEDIDKKMYSKSLTLAKTLAKLNDKKQDYEKLMWIHNNTTMNVKEKLSTVEEFYQKNKHKPSNKVQNFFGKELHLYQLVQELSEAYDKIVYIVAKISSELDLDIKIDYSKYGLK